MVARLMCILFSPPMVAWLCKQWCWNISTIPILYFSHWNERKTFIEWAMIVCVYSWILQVHFLFKPISYSYNRYQWYGAKRYWFRLGLWFSFWIILVAVLVEGVFQQFLLVLALVLLAILLDRYYKFNIGQNSK